MRQSRQIPHNTAAECHNAILACEPVLEHYAQNILEVVEIFARFALFYAHSYALLARFFNNEGILFRHAVVGEKKHFSVKVERLPDVLEQSSVNDYIVWALCVAFQNHNYLTLSAK